MFPPAESSSSTVPVYTVEQLRREISHLFDTADTTLDYPEVNHFRFRGIPLYNQNETVGYDEIAEIFKPHGYTPILRRENGRVSLYGYPFVIEEQPVRWIVPLLLFIGTILTTLLAGAMSDETLGLLAEQAAESELTWLLITNLWRGWPFCVSILLILGAHELGHYFAARYHKVPASLPFFIPMPFSPIGTMGAFILQRGPSKNVRTQFDIGAAGPLAGMVFAIPILILGLMLSEVGPLPTESYYLEGNSIAYALTKLAIFGQFLPSNGVDVSLSQVAWAGWTGFLVTGLNLLPVGQLDGGRVSQVLFGQSFLKQIYWPILIAMIALGFFAGTATWFVWAALLYFFGNRYETPLDETLPLDGRRRALAILTMVIFVLVFVPVPLTIVNP
ncbi:MAG: site-2 protease family protein [Ardenticatenaceae bacterium]|nr:site-2 protease family protein [Ardenticatenaceae bacterium]